MKTSIKLTFLLVLASASVFAANLPKTVVPPSKATITLSSLPSLKGLEVKVDGNTASKAVVIVYDADKNVVYKDVMPALKSMEKGYILTHLQDGQYSLEVIAKNQNIKKDILVYHEGYSKTFMVME
ncbi:hypothetical protein JN11_02713 [Mucilaginibacter frigoritolerans]|uniref:Secreted protein (Por secretion system target) n=1 Tax=Mucilaginibacter frigoritolerans TaxID=652788 RepID=A0A562U267_9SPHI|nr:hypothetical protein [Mucilaginibacter frigoritolerans]TWI99396.1 hypothetical protein JN11_02713 [Mucilaginibacter frigoritolerans]